MTLPAAGVSAAGAAPLGRWSRSAWVVQALAVQPGDTLLEIGCGRGSAVARICPLLTTGRVVAIDRSAAMIRLATERNRDHVAAGRAEFRQLALEVADFGRVRFDKIFAVNVNLFWPAPAGLDVIAAALAPTGSLYILHEAPGADRVLARVRRMTALLAEHGFTATTSVTALAGSATGACVVARPHHRIASLDHHAAGRHVCPPSGTGLRV